MPAVANFLSGMGDDRVNPSTRETLQVDSDEGAPTPVGVHAELPVHAERINPKS